MAERPLAGLHPALLRIVTGWSKGSIVNLGPEFAEETVQQRFFIILHVLVVIAGTAALWWFVFPDAPAEALADSISAGAIAGYAEILMMRLLA